MTQAQSPFARFAEKPAPRSVPASVRSRKLAPLFAWGVALLFVVAGAAFAFHSFPSHLAEDMALSRGASKTTGFVRESTATMIREGRVGSGTGKTVHKYRFEFSSKDGEPEEAWSYDSGIWQLGAEVPVEYLSETPEVARIGGGRRSETPLWSVIFVIVPVAGLFLCLVLMIVRRRMMCLLRQGTLTSARVSTGMRKFKSDQRYTLQVRFEVDGTDVVARAPVLGHEAKIAAKREESGDLVDLLYLPNNPKRCTLLLS